MSVTPLGDSTFRIEINNRAARVCDLRRPCRVRKKQSVELGADDGAAAVP